MHMAQSTDSQHIYRGTPGEWLVTMLQAFNKGDISAFEKVSGESAASINQQPALVGNAQRLREKIRVFALLEQLRDIPADCRTVAFSVCFCVYVYVCVCVFGLVPWWVRGAGNAFIRQACPLLRRRMQCVSLCAGEVSASEYRDLSVWMCGVGIGVWNAGHSGANQASGAGGRAAVDEESVVGARQGHHFRSGKVSILSL